MELGTVQIQRVSAKGFPVEKQGEKKLQVETSADFDAYVKNTDLMSQIINEMKEIPYVASEQPPAEDRHLLQRVEFPKEGGMLTYMDNHEYPFRGFPFGEFVDRIDIMKKIFRGFLSGLYYIFQYKNPFWLITLIPAIWVLKYFVRAAIYAFHRVVVRYKIKETRYSQGVHALYDAFNKVNEDEEKVIDHSFTLMLRDIVCMILEFDNAYRFRFQDLVSEIDQQMVRKNFFKELQRIIAIGKSREITIDIRDTWRLVEFFVKYYLRFDRKMKHVLREVFINIDIEKAKLTIEDKHYCKPRKDYLFGFINKNE